MADQLGRFLSMRVHHLSRAPLAMLYDSIEYFAGSGNNTRAHLQRDMNAVMFDKLYHCSHDCVTPLGLRLWIDAMVNTTPLATIWFGTKCSPYVSIAMSVHKRGLDNSYYGDTSRPSVVIGNQIASVTGLLYLLADLFGDSPVLEQPLTSCLPLLPDVRLVLAYTKSEKTVTWHGAFGGLSPKGLQLHHTSDEFRSLSRRRPKQQLTTLCDMGFAKCGKRTYTGKKQALKDSEAYSMEFAAAISSVTWRAKALLKNVALAD
jgi:hypothetical protein